MPGSGKKKKEIKNNKMDVKNPSIIVVPTLRNVDDTIVGIIIRNEKGFKIPPVKYNNMLNCTRSYVRNKDAYKSFSWLLLILNWRKRLVNNPIKIIIWLSINGNAKLR